MAGSNRISAPKIRIEADPDLVPLLPQYLENRKKDLALLKVAFNGGDYKFVMRMAHTIKGHAASYGFIRLTEICRGLEKAALSAEDSVIAELMREYEEYINLVELP